MKRRVSTPDDAATIKHMLKILHIILQRSMVLHRGWAVDRHGAIVWTWCRGVWCAVVPHHGHIQALAANNHYCYAKDGGKRRRDMSRNTRPPPNSVSLEKKTKHRLNFTNILHRNCQTVQCAKIEHNKIKFFELRCLGIPIMRLLTKKFNMLRTAYIYIAFG